MKNNRRDFLKLSALAGIGVAGANVLPGCTTAKSNTNTNSNHPEILKQTLEKHTRKFNMDGYAAPKLDTVRIGFIGIGSRGAEAVSRISHIDGVAIKAICDINPEKVESVKKRLNLWDFIPTVIRASRIHGKKFVNVMISISFISVPPGHCTPLWHFMLWNMKNMPEWKCLLQLLLMSAGSLLKHPNAPANTV